MATPDPTPIKLSGNLLIDGLLEPSNWVTSDSTLILTWSPHNAGGNWTSAELNYFQAAFDAWGAVANITFTRAAGPADFRNTTADLAVVATGSQLGNLEGADGLAFTPDPFYTNFELMGDSYTATNYPRSQGDIFIDDATNGSFSPGGYGFSVLLHEIGHALGLKHPHDAPRTFNGLGIGEKDDTAWTVMTYNSHHGPLPPLAKGWPVTPMPLDILAVQYIYGANMTYHTGDDTYSLDGTPEYRTIWDAGGLDTLDASAYVETGGLIIRLTPGAFNFHGEFSMTAIAYDVTIENVVGSSGKDWVYGNTADNVLSGGSGRDTLFGVGGNDLLQGERGNDDFYGGPGDDELQGDRGQDSMDGGPGDDVLRGGAGDDVLEGGVGKDHLEGGDLDDVLRGGKGADTLDGGGGADKLMGGKGRDVLIFDAEDTAINGGAGVDALNLLFTGDYTLDLGMAGSSVHGIELIDLGGGGNDTLILTAADVLEMTSERSAYFDDDTVQLLVRGTSKDQVISADPDWQQDLDVFVNGELYQSFSAPGVTLYIQAGVVVDFGVTAPPALAAAHRVSSNSAALNDSQAGAYYYDAEGNAAAQSPLSAVPAPDPGGMEVSDFSVV